MGLFEVVVDVSERTFQQPSPRPAPGRSAPQTGRARPWPSPDSLGRPLCAHLRKHMGVSVTRLEIHFSG